MSKRDDEKKIIDGMTNEALKSKFIQDVGSKARVDRSTLAEQPRLDQLREVLADVARDLQVIDSAPKGMEYVGSLSVHIYKSEILRTAAFATLTNLGTADVSLADGALRELNNNVKQMFGKRAQRLRSGF